MTATVVEQTSFSTWPGTSSTKPSSLEALVVVWLGYLKPIFIFLCTQESCSVGKVGECSVSGNGDVLVILPPEEKGWMRGKI